MKDNISFAELAKKRQSDRKYKDQAVEREKIIQCFLETINENIEDYFSIGESFFNTDSLKNDNFPAL